MPLHTQFIKISDKKMAYYDLGNPNAPAILMGHSYLWDKTMWREQFDALSSQYRLIVPDLWAHGESEGLPVTPTTITIRRIAEDNWQLMQKLAIDRFAIIGLSIGGMWGTQIALDHPDNVTALVLMGTFVGAEPPESQEAYTALMSQFKTAHGFTEPLIEAIWPYFYSKKLSKASPLIDELKARLRNIPKDKIDDIFTIGKSIFSRESNLEKLASLHIPLAIMIGEDDIGRPPSESEQMAKAANTKNLYYIKDAGHISVLEQPNDVNQYLLRFLETCPININNTI